MRTLTFEQITDGRFDDPDTLLDLLNGRIELIKAKLNIDGVEVTVENPYEIKWDARQFEPAHSQWRAKFFLRKSTPHITWNDIFGLINSVKAASYKFI